MCNTHNENMRKLTFILLVFFSVTSYCQKEMEISETNISKHFYSNLDSLNAKYDLQDLRKTEGVNIRIWRENEIITLGKNSEYLFHISDGENNIIERRKLAQITDLDSLYRLYNSRKEVNNKLHIDAFPIKIELSDSKNYDLVTFQRDDQMEELIHNIGKKYAINALRKEIIYNLPPGNYRRSMLGLKIDHLPKEEKSDFYLKIEPEIKAKLNVTDKTLPTELPLILINNKPHFFEDLNKLTLSNVEDYEIINDKMVVLYGTRARFGIIKVNTN